MNISATIFKLKAKKMTTEKTNILTEIELLWQEVQLTRTEINKTLKTNNTTDFLQKRKIVLIKMIKVRNYIFNLLNKVFSVEIKKTLHRYQIEKIQTPKWSNELTKFVYQECESLCKLREQSTGIKWQTDHMIPLQGELFSGLHCAQNFQVIPQYLNGSKNNKFIMTEAFEWLSFV